MDQQEKQELISTKLELEKLRADLRKLYADGNYAFASIIDNCTKAIEDIEAILEHA